MPRQAQFEHLRASELYCPTCRKLQPVRERLLLVLPQAELYDYRCTTCGLSLGSREVKAPVQTLVPASSLPAHRLVRRSPSRPLGESGSESRDEVGSLGAGGPRRRPNPGARGSG